MTERDDGDGPRVGREIHALIERLHPICRSITGDGVRQTLGILQELAPIEIHEVPSGTPVLDWTVPREWNVREAWIADPAGKKVVDFQNHSLHVLSYSTPIRARMPLSELRPHLHTLPEHPDWIPYRTSYYQEAWGFCLPHAQLESLEEGEYEVCIDSSLEPGHLTYGELLLPGESEREILISTHVCHPSLCNDNLSGIGISVHLARALAAERRRYSYRFLYVPGTIGSITWLARNREGLHRIAHGLTLVCLGDDSPLRYKRTFSGEAEIDRVVAHVLAEAGTAHEIADYHPYGYDERQYNSPGFRLQVGSLMRGRHGEFPEYHTSADDLDFVSPEMLDGSYRICRRVLDVLDGNDRFRSLAPYGEPQLGKRGIYRALGGSSSPGALQMAMLWVLACADGGHALLDVATRSGIDFDVIREAADVLLEHALLEPVSASGPGD